MWAQNSYYLLRIVIRVVSWPLYKDTYRVVTLLAIHSTIDTLQQKIEITGLKPFFVSENTNGLRRLHSTVHF